MNAATLNSISVEVKGNDTKMWCIEGAKVKETEKAVCLECNVTWTSNRNFKRNIWFPKSAVETTESGQYRAAEWAINAKCHDNIYNGHMMYFVNCDCPIYL